MKQSEERLVERLEKLKKGSAILCTVEILLSALIIFSTWFLVKPEIHAAETMAPVDKSAVAELEAMNTADVLDAIEEVHGIKKEREESIQASISLEESIEQSILASMAEEDSIEASIYESSVAEVSSIEESIAVNAPLAGSNLVAGKVNYYLNDYDIAYIRKLFSNVMVVGNSRAKNIVDCGILTLNEVQHQTRVSVDVIRPVAVQAAQFYRPKTLFIMGLNDVAYFDKNTERFIEEYEKTIDAYLEVNPNTRVYVMESLPLQDGAVNFFYRAWTDLPNFNQAMSDMCDRRGWTYVSASMYAERRFINSEDLAHYNKDFYFLWAQKMAKDMHLYEDIAGLNYEIDWSNVNETDAIQ